MPKRAKGSKQWRVTRAIHKYYTTNMTMAEIGDELGVDKSTVHGYVHSPPAEEVKEQLADQAAQVRLMAVEELRRHLREAGSKSRSATKPVKVYENDDGELEVKDIELEGGQVKKIPIVQDIKLLPDEEARFYARKEIRDALSMLIDLVGAAEPDRVELSGELDTGASEETIRDIVDEL